MFDNPLLRTVRFLFKIHDPLVDDDQSTYDYLKDDDYRFNSPFH